MSCILLYSSYNVQSIEIHLELAMNSLSSLSWDNCHSLFFSLSLSYLSPWCSHIYRFTQLVQFVTKKMKWCGNQIDATLNTFSKWQKKKLWNVSRHVNCIFHQCQTLNRFFYCRPFIFALDTQFYNQLHPHDHHHHHYHHH